MKKLQDTLVYRIMTIKMQLDEVVKEDFQNIGITKENFVTMYFIHENPGITQAELAELNHKDRNVITKFIDKLEKFQYVKRVQSPADRRSYCLYVTPEGEEIFAPYWKILTDSEKARLNRLTEDEQKQLMAWLEILMQ